MNHKIFLLLFIYLLAGVAAHAQQTEQQYLSGTGSDHTVDWDFFLTEGRNGGRWTTIPVPANWELQGFGTYNYGFDKDSLKGKEKGLYRHRFTVPQAWKGKQIDLVFEGVMTDATVKINGQAAGPMHQGAFYAFRYNISRLLHYSAENLLEVTVAKHSANASVNAAERKGDFWIFGGIFRPVYLEALPARHLSRVAINATASGDFRAAVYLGGAANTGKVQAQLYAPDGKKAGSLFQAPVRKGDSVVELNTVLSSPLLWSAEFPYLYRVEISLLEGDKLVHTISKTCGFRTVEVRERDGVYVNGVKIKFKGVNRHSFWPSTGRALNKSKSIEDVLMIKDMNMNAVRMSHYPPDAHFLDACDSLGLYVMDELAGWHGMYDTPTGSKLLEEMMVHDENHPSIVFWSNGNEGGHNTALDPLFAQHDLQKRPILHPWQTFSGIETEHYREYDYGIAGYLHGHNIVMPTEFLHGWFDGGHGAGLEDYWEAMWSNPLSAGGFLWDLADEGVVRTDQNGRIDTDKDHGADGIVGPYLQKEGSYFAIKEIWSPVHFERREITPSFDGRLWLENRYHFTNINQCSFTYALKTLRQMDETIEDGTLPAPDIKPSQKGVLQINLPENWRQYDVLYVTAYDPNKKEIFTWSFPVVRPAETAQTRLRTVADHRPVLEESDSTFVVAANNIHYRFDRKNGLLVQVKKGPVEIPFNRGPVIQEGVNNFGDFSCRFTGDTAVIASSFNKKTNYNTLQWTIYPSGLLKMQVNYFPSAYFTFMAGVNFSFPEPQIKGVEYMGYGPYRVWKNRMKGNRFGIWKKTYNNTETGEAPWVYPEFKGYYRNLYWCTFTMAAGSFSVFTPNEDLFLRLFTPAPKTDQWHNYEPLFPDGDISFMQAIPSIGSKTQRNETTGPMGMKNSFYDYEKDLARSLSIILYFDFSGT